MARGGLKPFVAIYDTFMQRAVDQVIVDVCLQNLPVVFLMDRAALSGEDGPTHHGVFGVSWMRSIPNLTVFSPRCVEELDAMIRAAAKLGGPVAIRYPRAEGMAQAAIPYKGFTLGKWEVMLPGRDVALIAVGNMTSEAVRMHKWLKDKGYDAQVVNASTIKPLDRDCLMHLTMKHTPYVVMEEQQLAGGLGSAIMEECLTRGLRMPMHVFAIADHFVQHGRHDELLKQQHLDFESMAQVTLQFLVEASEAQG
jgi:1-deoxy-D-xylulose-5-phosphate synthase